MVKNWGAICRMMTLKIPAVVYRTSGPRSLCVTPQKIVPMPSATGLMDSSELPASGAGMPDCSGRSEHVDTPRGAVEGCDEPEIVRSDSSPRVRSA